MDHLTRIQNWFLEHNEFLKDREDQEEMLELLKFYVIIFEKTSGIEHGDELVVKNASHDDEFTSYELLSGPDQPLDDLEFYLKLINIEFAYLEYEKLARTAAFRYFLYQEECESGFFPDELYHAYFDDFTARCKKQYQNYNFNKHVYKNHHNKVFFSVSELTAEEMEYLELINNHDQTLYEIFHDDGRMFIY